MVANSSGEPVFTSVTSMLCGYRNPILGSRLTNVMSRGRKSIGLCLGRAEAAERRLVVARPAACALSEIVAPRAKQAARRR
jgi:hypothetical protein